MILFFNFLNNFFLHIFTNTSIILEIIFSSILLLKFYKFTMSSLYDILNFYIYNFYFIIIVWLIFQQWSWLMKNKFNIILHVIFHKCSIYWLTYFGLLSYSADLEQQDQRTLKFHDDSNINFLTVSKLYICRFYKYIYIKDPTCLWIYIF